MRCSILRDRPCFTGVAGAVLIGLVWMSVGLGGCQAGGSTGSSLAEQPDPMTPRPPSASSRLPAFLTEPGAAVEVELLSSPAADGAEPVLLAVIEIQLARTGTAADQSTGQQQPVYSLLWHARRVSRAAAGSGLPLRRSDSAPLGAGHSVYGDTLIIDLDHGPVIDHGLRLVLDIAAARGPAVGRWERITIAGPIPGGPARFRPIAD